MIVSSKKALSLYLTANLLCLLAPKQSCWRRSRVLTINCFTTAMLFQEANPHLGFGVGTQPGDGACAPELRHLGVELVGQDDGERHALLRLVGGVAEHQTLRGQTQRHLTGETEVAALLCHLQWFFYAVTLICLLCLAKCTRNVSFQFLIFKFPFAKHETKVLT